MCVSSRKRARTASEGEEEGEAVPVAGGFEAPIFGARVVGQVTTLALEGEDGPLFAVASDRAGGWYVTTEHSLLHVSAAGRSRTVATCEDCRRRTVATCEDCRRPGIALSPDGSALFLADNGNHKILRVEVATGAVTMLAGSGEHGDADGVGDAAQFNAPYGVTISPDGGALFVPDGSVLFVADFGGYTIRRVEVATGVVTTVAGSGAEGSADGVGGAAQFNSPIGIDVSPDGSALFVAEFWNHKIRHVEVARGAVTTLAGSSTAGSADGVGGEAQLDNPVSVALSPDGSTLLH
ncbi:hypothetical protein EMIHUDRAFT_222699 [Emiliania huxleyi CCMP1516]|uniref:SMP-30/Gluconolactonase/LRE-like region domain-containing protein n=2 Tax=Emiliania huxleyi TaxID=2903 RepID=A0A0D3KXU6_EMIH1|nr:hypothetical protein EMIHUDRAFT_222699 [Emiliania huxleyi CCMP1516]EOD40581.1 hypothetical protein EMIHUDRAFT_222699 [Emiliania huxleyi CCMP1516]|eukprot:XP_005793010.1 hypothetical protein EMIHUDRAFT_222699 [Emiliania huxleyi CCMP1516]